jgi:acyl carrier protein
VSWDSGDELLLLPTPSWCQIPYKIIVGETAGNALCGFAFELGRRDCKHKRRAEVEADIAVKNAWPRGDVERALKIIACDQLGVGEDEIKPESMLGASLGADSLDAIELIMEAEAEFGVEVDDGVLEAFWKGGAGTFGEFVDLIVSLTRAG